MVYGAIVPAPLPPLDPSLERLQRLQQYKGDIPASRFLFSELEIPLVMLFFPTILNHYNLYFSHGHQRVRSLGNLADLASYHQGVVPNLIGDPPEGIPDGFDMTPSLHRSHTITERPTSMYASRQALAQMPNSKVGLLFL